VCPSNSYCSAAQLTQCDFTDRTFQMKKDWYFFVHAASLPNSAHCQPAITEVSEQYRAQFTHKRNAEFGRFCRS